jgi:hypothetical protein
MNVLEKGLGYEKLCLVSVGRFLADRVDQKPKQSWPRTKKVFEFKYLKKEQQKERSG